MSFPTTRSAEQALSRQPSVRRQGFAKGAGAHREFVDPAPAKPAKFRGSLVFAGVAFTFGLALLLGWRVSTDGGSPNSILLVAGMFTTIAGGYIGANELGLLSVLTGDSDSDGDGGSGDGGSGDGGD